MKANLAHGRIAGLPATGGYVTLENADATALVNATTSLVREFKGMVVPVGIAAAGLLLLNAMAKRREREEEEQFRLHEQQRIDTVLKPNRPLSGLCRVVCDRQRQSFCGICLDQHISFTSGMNSLELPIEQVASIFVDGLRYDCKEDRDSPRSSITVLGVDGSVFGGVYLKQLPRFQTIAGIYSPDLGSPGTWLTDLTELRRRPDLADRITPLTEKEVLELRSMLLTNLQQLRLDLLEPLGLDLVRKYFHVEIESPVAEVDEPQVPKQITTPAKCVLEVVLTDCTLATMVACVDEGHSLTVDFGQAGAGATATLKIVEGWEPFRVQLSVRDGFLCIAGANLIVHPITMDGLHPTELLTPTDNVWRLDCRQHSHVVTLNNSGILTVHPRST